MIGESMVIATTNLSKRYRFTWALRECNVRIPAGKVAAIVGPNGSGKSTLLRIAAGLTRPTSGTVEVLGQDPQQRPPSALQGIGYLDQERPLYQGFRVSEMLRFAAATNPSWNMARAVSYLDLLRIAPRARISSLSGGQQAQVALTLCLGKEPDLLILDEPAAALDPLARQDLLRLLMQQVASNGSSVILSTHAISDVVAICDYLVILAEGHMVLADDLDFVLESHRLLTPSSASSSPLPEGVTVIETKMSQRESSYLVQVHSPLVDPHWNLERPSIEEIVLGYLRKASTERPPRSEWSSPRGEGSRR